MAANSKVGTSTRRHKLKWFNGNNLLNVFGLALVITAKDYAEFQTGYMLCNAGKGPKKTWQEMQEPFFVRAKPSEKSKGELKQRKRLRRS